MLVQESYVNLTENYRIGDSEPYEPFTTDTGQLYRAYRKECGRCTGKVWIDRLDGTHAIGWIFVKRARYEDTREPYLQETWVTLLDALEPQAPTYHAIGGRS